MAIAAAMAWIHSANWANAAEPEVQGAAGTVAEESSPKSSAPPENPSTNTVVQADIGAASTTPGLPEATAQAPQPKASQSDDVAKLRDELAQLRADFETTRASSDTQDTGERKIDFYGFMDMGFQKLWMPESTALLGTGTTRANTFVLGNVNLYVDANPNQTWRVLTEMRFTNYPNGQLVQYAVPALGQNEQRTNTLLYDVNSPDPGWNSVNWGSIVMQQAWIQGTVTDWFGVRVGYWLTPFGIWNVDHGTPTLIGLTPPSFTGGRFYPRNQLGIQATGAITSRAWTFNYTAYVSNGKTVAQLDPTNDKAFGFRLSAKTMRPFPMQFGLAGYTGRFSQVVANVASGSAAAVAEREVVAYRQWDVGADISFDIHALRFRTELAVERVDYEAGKYELSWGIPGAYVPNHLSWGWYTIAAYRLPWLGLEPYLACELYRYPTPLSEDIAVPGIGLNIHFNTEVQVKTQFTRAYFFDFDGDHDHSGLNTSMLASRLVVAY